VADGRTYPFEFDGTRVDITLRDEAGKIDLNAASHELLLGLFIALGEPRGPASQLAGAILDWRDVDSLTQVAGGAEDPDYASAGFAWGAKDAAFETVAEVEQVLGMRPALYASAAPYLTVYTGNAVPDATRADGLVLRAMGVQRPPSNDPSLAGGVRVEGSGTYSIESRARRPDGRRAHLSLVMRMGGNGLPGSAYTPLRWQDGAMP
jgi:general secretion pathway protein K